MSTDPAAVASAQIRGVSAVASAQIRDVSDYQPVQSEADWDGYAGGITKATEGTGWTSVTAGPNIANMRKVQARREFGVGFYHFFHPGEDPVLQARHFAVVVRACGYVRGDMLAADVEIMSGAEARHADETGLRAPGTGSLLARAHLAVTAEDLAASAAQVDAAAMAFSAAVHDELGTAPQLVYTMHSVGQYLTECARHYPLWFAWPSNSPPPADMLAPWADWRIWQYRWAGGGLGDENAFNGTAAQFFAWIKSFTAPPVTGPYRHVTDGGESLADVAAARATTTMHLVAETIKAQAPRILKPHTDAAHELTAFARYLDVSARDITMRDMNRGLVYYTSNP